MSNNINTGVFRKRPGFTMVCNTLVRDPMISAKAKGIYLVIMSYITLEDFQLSKSFLVAQFSDGEKSFESGWKELKNAGYLKTYSRLMGGKGAIVEYELLDEPQPGAHTFYLDAAGNVTCTNLTRNLGRPRTQSDGQHPHKQHPQKGDVVYGGGLDGGSLIRLSNNTPPIPPSQAQEPEATDGACEEEAAEPCKRDPSDKVGRACLTQWAEGNYEGTEREEIAHLLEDFADQRRRLRKPIVSKRAANGLIKALLQHSAGGQPALVCRVIEQAITHNWLSFYSLKGDDAPAAPIEREDVPTW